MSKRISLIILSVIGLLFVGLLLIAISRFRDTAQRLECRANLRMLGLALHNYNDTNDCLPPATVDSDKVPPEQRVSWLVRVWSYIESSAISHDPNQPWNSPRNAKLEIVGMSLLTTPVGEVRRFRCPANPNFRTPGEIDRLHYVGIAGLSANAASLPKDHPRVGVFGYDRAFSLSYLNSVGDTSNMMMVAETATANGPWTAGGFASVRGVDPEKPPYLGLEGQFSSYHHATQSFPGVRAFTRTNVLFVDASVRSLNEVTDPAIIESLATVRAQQPADRIGDP